MPADGDLTGVARCPRSSDGLEVNEAPDGLVIYDARTNRVHHLNPTAGAVYVLCTGEHCAADIALQLQSLFGLGEPPSTEVERCLAELNAQGLIQ